MERKDMDQESYNSNNCNCRIKKRERIVDSVKQSKAEC